MSKENFWMLMVDFQLHLMKQRFRELAKADTTWVGGKTTHSWVWEILKKLHHMDGEGRATVLNRIIGDYKKCALSPIGPEGSGARRGARLRRRFRQRDPGRRLRRRDRGK